MLLGLGTEAFQKEDHQAAIEGQHGQSSLVTAKTVLIIGMDIMQNYGLLIRAHLGGWGSKNIAWKVFSVYNSIHNSIQLELHEAHVPRVNIT